MSTPTPAAHREISDDEKRNRIQDARRHLNEAGRHLRAAQKLLLGVRQGWLAGQVTSLLGALDEARGWCGSPEAGA